MNRRKEILEATLEADRLHAEFGSKKSAELGDGRVDVFGMLWKRDIPVIFRPLKNLLGAFIDDPAEGIMITTKRSLRIQRFTAAHEFGHSIMHHSSSLDGREILARSSYSQAFDIREFQANIFAARLLTPPWLIVQHMKRQGWTRENLKEPLIVYQLALRIGSSYSATCHALSDAKAITSATRFKLLEVSTKTIKQLLVSPYQPTNWYGDVWLITGKDDGLVIEGSRSDLVVFKLPEHANSGYLWQFGDLVDAGMSIVSDHQTLGEHQEDHIGGVVFRNVVAESDFDQGAEGKLDLHECRPWQKNGELLNSIALDLCFSGPVPEGFMPVQREALLKIA